jgi:Flp pilus assembly protein TadG
MWRRLFRAVDGAVAVETALVSSLILVPLLLGLWDVAQLAMSQAELDEALEDAISYIAGNMAAGTTWTTSGITSAAQASYGSGVGVSSSQVCYCVETGSSTPTAPTSVSCSGSCSSGSTIEQYESITVSMTVSIPFTVSYLGSSVTLSSTGQIQTGT